MNSPNSQLIIDPQKMRAARAVLSWTQKELALRAGVSHGAITRFELGGGTMMRNNILAIQRVFEAAGITFHGAGLEWSDGDLDLVQGNGTPEKPFTSELIGKAAGKAVMEALQKT